MLAPQPGGPVPRRLVIVRFNNGEFTQYLRRIGVILDKECVDADRLPLPLNCHCDISKLPTGQTQSLTSHQRYHRSVIRLHLLANGV